MNPSQNDSFGSLLNGQGGNMQTGGNVSGFNNVGMGGQQTLPLMPVSSGRSIVLNNGDGERKPRKWVVVLVMVLLFAAVVGGIFAVWKSGIFGHNNNEDVSKVFYELANYVMSGESNDGSETTLSSLASRYEDLVKVYSAESGAFIYAISMREDNNFKNIEEYYKKLDEKKQSLFASAEKVVEEKTLDRYVLSLRILKNAIDYRAVEDDLIAAYENDGESGAELFLQRNVFCEDDEWPLTSICYIEANYYEAFLEEHIEGNDDEDEAYRYLTDILSWDSLWFINIGVKEMQNRFLEELKNDQ